ncbi:hypothetical protein GGP99_001938 [Salinibacter ruber]|uniref:Secreted protein n=1 Tax=Salinibacter ruber TaxID=146919 RepID=A0AAW5P823_9BACT|nr:hypothetical protein [Salinibacter ruber]
MLLVLVVPSGPPPFVFCPSIDPVVLLDCGDDQPPQERQVLRCILSPNLTMVFAEGYIVEPVQFVFNLPVLAGRLKNLLSDSFSAGDEAATRIDAPVASVHVGVAWLVPYLTGLQKSLDISPQALLIAFEPKHVVARPLLSSPLQHRFGNPSRRH